MKKILLAIIFIFTFSITAQSSEVKVEKSADGWRLLVDGKPFFVKGVCYLPAKVGESMDDATYRDWMTMDDDADGRNDPAFQSWIDSNQNNQQDSNEPEIGDFKLLEEMGCNAIRIYHHSSDRPEVKLLHHSETAKKIYNHKPNKELLRKLHKDYGIWVAMGDYLGSYAVGSGANWEEGTDYTDPKQRENMLISVAGMVQDFKDEPYILFWILGNENNYSFTHTNAEDYPLEWATLVNEAAELIHSLDPDHPVCLANGETHFLKLYNKKAPAIDILGMNSYREPDFGGMWFEVKEDFDRPVLLTEFGDGSPEMLQGRFDEEGQNAAHERAWKDIAAHCAGKKKPGNAIGGFVFEWMDQWWKAGDPQQQQPGPDSFFFEYYGLFSQGDGKHSPLLRQPRPAYFTYKELWTKDTE